VKLINVAVLTRACSLDGCHCKYMLTQKLFVQSPQNPSMFLLFKLTFVRLQLLNVYDFSVLSTIWHALGIQ